MNLVYIDFVFELINNAAKQQQERKHPQTILTQIDETQTVKSTTKHKIEKKTID